MSTQAYDSQKITINEYIREAKKSLGWDFGEDLQKEVDKHYAELKKDTDTSGDYNVSARFLAMECLGYGNAWSISEHDTRDKAFEPWVCYFEEREPWFVTAVKLQVLCDRLVDKEDEEKEESDQMYETEPVNIPSNVLKEFDLVRQSGETNMMDQKVVLSIADAKNCTDLSNFLRNDVGVNTAYEQLLEAFNEWKQNQSVNST
jgi:hypothetical protein